MFKTLLASKPRLHRSPAGVAFSALAHMVVIILAVWATAHAAIPKPIGKPPEDIKYFPVKNDPPPPPAPKTKAPPANVTVAPPPPIGFQLVTAPVDIPDVIPNIDLSKKVTDEDDFSGHGAPGGTSHGVTGGTGPVTDQPYYDFQVDKTAGLIPGSPHPSYPEALRAAGVEGTVQVQYVVDTTGRAELASLKVISSASDQFSAAVREALPRMRFYPAESGGHKVREQVQQTFTFDLRTK